jgi:hypothetical protein
MARNIFVGGKKVTKKIRLGSLFLSQKSSPFLGFPFQFAARGGWRTRCGTRRAILF